MLNFNMFYLILFQGVALNSLRFLFDGQRIADDMSPKQVFENKSLCFCDLRNLQEKDLQ